MGGRGTSSGYNSGVFHKATTHSEADSLGDKVSGSWQHSTDYNLTNAVVDYTGSSYYSLNKMLRGLENPSEMKKNQLTKLSDSISKVIKANPLKENIVVHRGVGLDAFGDGMTFKGLKGLVGKTLQDKGFMSTSLLKSNAFSSDVTMVVRAKKGTPAIYVKPVSQHKHEQEVLFDKKTKFKVTKVVVGSYDTTMYVDVV